MNCEDLLHIKSLKDGLNLVAGDSGLNRDIRWIYFADCMQCIKECNPNEFIHGNELIVITDQNLTSDDNVIISIISAMNEKNVAGFVINYGQISDKVKSFCDEIEVPLFELSLKLHLIDFSQIICKVLIEEESKMNSLDSLLSTILYDENFNEENIISLGRCYGLNLNRPHRILEFDIVDFQNKIKEQHLDHEDDINEKKESLRRIIKRGFRNYGLENVMIMIQSHSAIVLIPADLYSDDMIIDICREILDTYRTTTSMELCVGIGNSYSYVEEIKNSYREASKTIELMSKLKKENNEEDNIYFFKDSGIYCLIMQIKDEKYLNDFVDSQLKKLFEVDDIQERCLSDTLEAYLFNNCNANITAQKLFIHRNTMRYRLDKIKEILGNNLDDSFSVMQLQMAYTIRKYLNKNN